MVSDSTKCKYKNDDNMDNANVSVKMISPTTPPSTCEQYEEELFTEAEMNKKVMVVRKRKRHILNAIRSQMEFYFGDANLSKDRFLKQLIDKDPFVPLETFLTFNKMKSLTQSVEQIAKSLTNSQLLELNETQLKVRRKTALPAERNVDDKTLYVESLPANADHDWLRDIFIRFGPISYISLPRYAVSRKIKEFAFIEFERESSVENAVKAFRTHNGVLELEKSDPASLCSVRSFIREQQQKKDPQASIEIKANAVDGDALTERPLQTSKPNLEADIKRLSRKRMWESNCKSQGTEETALDNESEGYVIAKKRLKMDTKLMPDTKQSAELCQTETNESEYDENNDIKDGVEKKRRRHKKKKSKTESNEQEMDPSCFELKILPKLDWKRLRNKYLNLQRQKVAAIKRNNWRQGDDLSPSPQKRVKSDHSGSGGSRDSSGVHKMSMNFYGAGGTEIEDATIVQTTAATKIEYTSERSAPPLFTKEPGLIVEISLLEPCVNIKEFKAEMRQYATVKYVDIKEGAIKAYIRLESALASEEFINKINCAEYKCKLLRGKSEARYWKKIEQDRDMKLNKKIKVPQKRGRERVTKLIATHIHFNDDEEDANAINEHVTTGLNPCNQLQI